MLSKTSRQSLVIFWQHCRRYPLAVAFVTLGLTLAALSDLVYPVLTKRFFDALARPPGETSDLMTQVLQWIGLCLAFHWLGWRIGTFAICYLETHVMRDLDVSNFEALHGHSFRFFQNNFVGSLVKKLNRFSRAFETVADRVFFNIFTLSIRLAGALIALAWLNKGLALILLAWLVIYFALVTALTIYKLRFDVKTVAADTKCTGILADTITNTVNIKVFTGLKREQQRFHEAKEEQHIWRKKSWDFSLYVEAAQGLLSVILELAILYWGVHLWKQGQLGLGDFALIQGLLLMILIRIFEVSRVIKDLYRALADAEEMTEILMTPYEVEDKPGAQALRVSEGRIDFESVGFAHKHSPRLFDGLSLSFLPGERVALVGPSGSGKSTMTRLILRFFDIQSGHIRIDGQSLRDITRESLRQNISYVPQEPILFHRPLIDNIRYGRPGATDEEVIEAAKRARCHEFITRLPQGYHTLVGERGVKLSGGERQRVAIARSLLKDAPILILDEATSSLDSESEVLIQAALEELMKGRTTIVIAHRLSTIMAMDRILVLQDGAVLEQGSHDELLAESGLYRKLWDLQAGGFLDFEDALKAEGALVG